jgi:hypothetical protein
MDAKLKHDHELGLEYLVVDRIIRKMIIMEMMCLITREL